MLFLQGCSTTRHVPEGSLLLDNVSITVDDSSKTVKANEMNAYLRQQPNHKMLWSMKFRLGVYNMSGNDSTKWWNRWIRKLGEAPVLYDSTLTMAGVEQLEKAMVNKGFLDAKVSVDTVVNPKKKKINVNYRIDAGEPHVISDINYAFPDTVFSNMVLADTSKLIIQKGDLLDRNLLEMQRELISNHFRESGYYGFSKEYVTFNADTTEGSKEVTLTMKVNPPYQSSNKLFPSHDKYVVRDVIYVLDYDPSDDTPLEQLSSRFKKEDYRGLTVLYEGRPFLRENVLWDNCYITPGAKFRQSEVENTYQALSRLSILKFINIRFLPVAEIGEDMFIDAYILLTPGKSQSVSFELEGTNSEGDLGVAAAVTYQHRNVGKGSETLSAKIRGAYESLSGNLEGLIHNRYMEYSVDLGVNFPKFKAPFLSERFKRKIKATSELTLALSYQERPEYTRIISDAAWSYRWTDNRNNNRYVFSPININYVYLPESTYDFIDQIAPDNPLLRYSYEDHFIMSLGFSFYHSNLKGTLPWETEVQRDIYTIRANVEFAGNFLYLINEIIRPRSHVGDNPYKIFGIHYSQYMKLNSDFSYLRVMDMRNTLAFHLGFGIGYPYGNSTILPFEKRFYGGGANGVRGWDVRTLGPGSYPNTNSVSDFINQCGDIRLIASVELRTKLFWVLESAVFIDAGNIWTIHNYPNQPGGMFYFNRFYKQLAGAYGIGLRFNFSYFLLRFDMGMKAHNPASGAVAWPMVHPNWHRDSSFHFSIGYPF